MPVYNGGAYLPQAIESVLAQSYGDFELLIVDDLSSDNSVEVAEQYLHDRRVVLLRNEMNLGVAGARNRALASSHGEFVTFLDQDDIWLARKLELQVTAISTEPSIGLLHAEYARIDADGALLPHWQGKPATSFANPDAPLEIRDVFSELFLSNDIQPLTTMIRRSVLDAVGSFNPALRGTDDYELWLRIALRYPIGHLRTIVGYWRSHPTQQSNRGYEQLLMRLAAIDSVIDKYPESRARVPSAAYRKRMHSMCSWAADHNLYILRNYTLAKNLFARSIGYKPNDIVCAAKWLYCSAPEPLREYYRQVKRALGSFRNNTT